MVDLVRIGQEEIPELLGSTDETKVDVGAALLDLVDLNLIEFDKQRVFVVAEPDEALQKLERAWQRLFNAVVRKGSSQLN